MQKLIILGGNPETKQLVECANNLGIFSIVIDPNSKAPAKEIASKSYDIDGFDIEKIAKVAKSEQVDGVLVGVADILVRPYYELCQKLNLPCYASKEAIEYLTSKDNFNQICKSHDIETIPSFEYEAVKREDFKEFPLVLKPVDNGGGVGIRICEKKEDFEKSYKRALDASKKKIVLIERWMECDDMFSHYTIQNGTIYLSVVADRITRQLRQDSTPVCILARYPSKYIDEYINSIDQKVRKMIQDLNIKDGILNIQFFKERDHFFAYDPGFRLQGEGMHFYLKDICGFDHRKMLIEFALSGRFGKQSIQDQNDPFFHGKRAYTIWLMLKSGRIGEIKGIEEIKKEETIIHIVQRFYKGDEVKEEYLGTERQVFSRIYIVTDTKEEAIQTVEKIRQKVHVYDENNQEMILDFYDSYIKEITDE